MQRLGGNPKKINPLVPVDLVIDHSVQVDYFNSADALELNIDMEFARNRERYEFLRWGQKAFNNFRVVPPGTGIVHQVNLEYLAKVVFLGKDHAGVVAFPDSLVGTDSHTTMIDGLGVVGWGVGGIEAEGVMLGQPIYMPSRSRRHGAHRQTPPGLPRPISYSRSLKSCAKKVVGKFVEFFGAPGFPRWPSPIVPRSETCRPSTAHDGLLPVDDQTSVTCIRPAARKPRSISSIATRRNRDCSAPQHAGADIHKGGSTRPFLRSSRVSPGPASARPHRTRQ
jgi:aconitate hydratase